MKRNSKLIHGIICIIGISAICFWKIEITDKEAPPAKIHATTKGHISEPSMTESRIINQLESGSAMVSAPAERGKIGSKKDDEFSTSLWNRDGTVSKRFAAMFDLTPKQISSLNKIRINVKNALIKNDIENSSIEIRDDMSIRISIARYPKLGASEFSSYNKRLKTILGLRKHEEYQRQETTAFAEEIPNIGLLRKEITLKEIRVSGVEVYYHIDVERYGLLVDDRAGTTDEVKVYRGYSHESIWSDLDKYAAMLKELLPSQIKGSG